MCEEFSSASASVFGAGPETFSERRRLAGGRALTLGAVLGLLVICVPVGMLGGAGSVPGSAAAEEAAAAAQNTPTPTPTPTSTSGPTSTPAPTSSPAVTDSLSTLCGMAAKLTGEDKPAEALALIEKVRGQVRSPALAATTACEAQRLAAVLKIQQTPEETPAGTTFAQQVGANWDRFAAEWIDPLVKAGPALLGLVAAFLVLGRLLVLLPKISGARKRPVDRAALALAGLAFILLGSCLIVLAPTRQTDVSGQLAGGGLLALIGSLVLATYLSSRLRLSLDVRDTKGNSNKVDVSRIGALLHELGGDPPRGLEIPEGADVTALGDEAMPLTYTNKVLAAIQKLVVSIFGVTPWRVVVSATNDDSFTVAMARNGASVGAATIDRNELRLAAGSAGAGQGSAGTATKAATGAELELHKMAAAYILTTLAGKHYGFDGLCGTTNWRSLGLHYIATTDPPADIVREKRLLGAALDYDHGNMLAEVALQNRMFRESTDPPTIKTYAEWLRCQSMMIRTDMGSGAKSVAGYTPLLYRIEMTFLSVVLNLPPEEPEFQQLLSLGRQTAKNLLGELEPTKRVPMAGPLIQEMRLHAALAYHDLYGAGVGVPPEPENASDSKTASDQQAEPEPKSRAKAEAEAGAKAWQKVATPATGKPVPYFVNLYNQALASVAPLTAYNAACSIARNKGPEADVRRRLEYAFTDSGNREWAQRDPELAELRKKEKFLHFLGVKPRQDFWKLEAFEPYEKQLRKAGISKARRPVPEGIGAERYQRLPAGEPLGPQAAVQLGGAGAPGRSRALQRGCLAHLRVPGGSGGRLGARGD